MYIEVWEVPKGQRCTKKVQEVPKGTRGNTIVRIAEIHITGQLRYQLLKYWIRSYKKKHNFRNTNYRYTEIPIPKKNTDIQITEVHKYKLQNYRTKS